MSDAMSRESRKKVSVILAAYHGEKYIAEQLKSLFQQTHPVDEILIGDDSLDDATVQAVQAVKEDFHGVLKIIRNPRSLGVISNFEELYKIADGDIVFFCDQDDVWLPNKVELLVRELELHPECDLVFCDSFCVAENLTSCGCTLFQNYGISKKKIRRLNQRQAFRVFLEGPVFLSGHNIALRKPVSYPIYPFHHENLGEYHDAFLGYFFAYLERIRCLDIPLTYYRRHSQSQSVFFQPPQERGSQNLPALLDARAMIQTLDHMIELSTSLKEMISERGLSAELENFRYLDDYLAFTVQRRECLHQDRLRRISQMSIPNIIQYFRYFRGFRTLVHDLLTTKAEPCNTK